MNRSSHRRAVASLVVLSLFGSTLAASAPAFAADKSACVPAYESTQKQRKAGKLKEAHENALVCAASVCPSWVRDDCATWVTEIEKSQPTIVISAQDPDGNDLDEVEVTIDGESIAKKLDGRALTIDPGTHTLVLDWKPGQSVEKKLVVAAGEKNRRVKVQFPRKKTDDLGKDTGATTGDKSKDDGKADDAKGDGKGDAAPTEEAKRPVPFTVWLFGATGVAGLAAWGGFGAIGLSKKSDLDARACKPGCPQSDVDAIKQNFLFADVGLVIGAAGLGTALVLFLTRPEVKEPSSAPAVSIAPIKGGAFTSFSFSF